MSGSAATDDAILHRLRRLDADLEAAMVIGHNRGMEDLALGPASRGDRTRGAATLTALVPHRELEHG